MACANSGNVGMVEWLVAKGADPNLSMDTGWTALHAAAKNGHRGVLEVLLKHGGDKSLTAIHREFGKNLLVEDVTVDENILDLLNRY